MSVAVEAVATLVAAQNPNGGWGWRAGGPGNTECTALAVWAVSAHGGQAPAVADAVHRGLAWLRASQRADGGWPAGDQVPESSWMSAVAILALTHFDSSDAHAVRGGSWLLGQTSRGYPWMQRLLMRIFAEPSAVEQDAELVGWPWMAGTTAWVEPTAYSLLALKQLAPLLPQRRTAERIRQGELVLADRMCYGGGWNYGNKKVMGEELEPYPDTTALALLALHDRPSDGTTVSLARLKEMLIGNRSALVLALTALCLQLYGEDVAPLRAELRERVKLPGLGDDIRTLSLMLLALNESSVPFRSRGNG